MLKFVWKAICLAVAVEVFFFVLSFIEGFLSAL